MGVDQTPINAVASGTSQSIGHYHFDTLTGEWEWDDALFRMHGYEPGSVRVDTDLIMAHKHPDERDEAARVIEDALLHGEPFSAYQRIVTADGQVRNVVVVGAGVVDEHRAVVALDGFFIDLTSDVRRHEHDAAEIAVSASAEHRAAIEQAKGMIMVTYGIDADAAFAMLRWWSMQANVKLHVLADRLVSAASELQMSSPQAKIRADQLLQDLANGPRT